MFCKNCGIKLADDAVFCPACGTRKTEIPEAAEEQDIGAKIDGKENLISKIWNSPLFTKAAIKFGYVFEILAGIVQLVISVILFSEKSFWGVVFGLLFVAGGLGSCLSSGKSLISSKKGNDGSKIPDEAALNKKKRNLCIGAVVIIIAIILL